MSTWNRSQIWEVWRRDDGRAESPWSRRHAGECRSPPLVGRWVGIDALVGEQTREHDDLDCVIALCDAPIPRDALAALGFIVSLDELPTHFVVRDRCDRRIDFHTVTFDAIGAATQRLQNGTVAPYRAHGFTG